MITNSMSLLNPYLKSIKGFHYKVTSAVIEICLSCNRKRQKEEEDLQGVGTVQIQGKQELLLVMWELGLSMEKEELAGAQLCPADLQDFLKDWRKIF